LESALLSIRVLRQFAEHALPVLADPVKTTTPEALKALHGDGIRIVVLTGDNRTAADAVARKLDINEVEADVVPDQKSAVVRRLNPT
jgi:Cu+-exporting ATPase